MPDENDEWGGDVVPATQPTGRSQEQRSAGFKQDAGANVIKKHFQYSSTEQIPLNRVPSSVLPHGYESLSVVGVIGPPGGGKTRLCLQEAMDASKKGANTFYVFNETVDIKFKATIKRIAKELGIANDRDLKRIYFWDATKHQLGTANYDAMESIAQRLWVQNVRYWIENECDGEPRFVIFDSFTNVTRRYTPQTPIFHQYLTHGLAELYEEKKVEPVTIMIYQKSLSPKELNTDAVYGGYGVNHEIDTEILLKKYDVDIWAQRNFGWRQGTKVYTLSIPKDRFPEAEDEERVLLLKDGRLKLGDTIGSYIDAHKETIRTIREEPVGQAIEGWEE
jgi:KaiC/GvpD/RAD55 family RecA-like ATPase